MEQAHNNKCKVLFYVPSLSYYEDDIIELDYNINSTAERQWAHWPKCRICNGQTCIGIGNIQIFIIYTN